VLHRTYSRIFGFLKSRQQLFFHLAAVFLVSMVITLLFWKILPADFLQSDSSDYTTYYEPVAHNILNGVGFFRLEGVPALSYPPGFPILLAGIFGLARTFGLPESLLYSAFVLLCMGLSSALIFLLSEKIWGIHGSWFSGLFFMTYPFVLGLTKQPNSERPFMVAFYASIYVFWLGLNAKNPGLLLGLSGVLGGVAMLIRPIAVGMGLLLFGLFLILDKKRPFILRFLLGLVLVLGNFLTVLPWEIWVYGQTGQGVLLSTGGVPSIRDGLTFAIESKNYRQEIEIPEDVANLQSELATEADSMKSLGGIARTITKHFMEDPLAVVKLFLIKAARSWYGTDSARMETSILEIQLFYGVIILLASFSVWRNKTKPPGLFLLIWGFVFYFWLMTIMALSILRYMVPAIGLLFLLIPGLLNVLLRRSSSSSSR
jgi:4-amino-4-deoxy-L-arabinose transferase-like glycosyltransferase